MERFACVIVDILNAQVDRLFTYIVPEGMSLACGTRVLVPFGTRTIEGYVLSFSDTTEVEREKLRAIIRPLEDYPALLAPLIELAREMAQKNRCPLAATLRLMLPAQMRGGRVKVKTERVARLLISGEEIPAARQKQSRSPKRQLLIDLLSDGEEHALADLKILVRAPEEGLSKLEEQGIVRITERETLRQPRYDHSESMDDFEPTPSQREVLSEILPAVRRGKGAFLLHGVTGSGKTEVYVQAVRECLRLKKGAIVLVPEIVLTPQMVGWFKSRFGEVSAVLHSRLSVGEKFDEWRRIRSGQARVVIGARSAVFAPVENLGIIIVDEEHEQSYFSERTPCYDAREVAQSRVQREGAVLLLASATPGILTFAKAQKGDLTLLEMMERVNGRPMPTVQMVDMREELRLGNKGMFSHLLQDKLRQCLQNGQQAMLFINRRGYAPSVVCRRCGHVLHCRDCDVSMTYHAPDQQMRCHYCGHHHAMPETCPECGGKYLKACGVGTQRVEEEVRRLFPGVEIVRMDYDTTGGKDAHRDLIARFRSGRAQVMIGTQMIAKGLDFPNVTLVGVVLADLSVNLPDYRSPERTFQLLTQVAGRAGRADLPGEVVVQTYKPEHYALASAAKQDYRSFFQTEFARRRRDLYPPFTVLARLLCEAKDEQTAREVSGKLFTLFGEAAMQHPEWKRFILFYREDESPIKRIMGRARSQVYVKLVNHRETTQVLDFLNELTQREWPCDVVLEINPSSMA